MQDFSNARQRLETLATRFPKRFLRCALFHAEVSDLSLTASLSPFFFGLAVVSAAPKQEI